MTLTSMSLQAEEVEEEFASGGASTNSKGHVVELLWGQEHLGQIHWRNPGSLRKLHSIGT
jgi:hypothetical protein